MKNNKKEVFMVGKIFSVIFFMLFLFVAVTCNAEDVKLQKKMDECAYVLDEIMMMPEYSIPEDLLANCQAIGIFPSTLSGGFVFGGKYGRGIVITKSENGEWSAPAFFVIGGASWGFQIGGQATDYIFVITTKRGLDWLLNDKLTLGGDVSVAAGPVGRKAEASTDVMLKANVLSYSRSKGLFAGVALQGAFVAPNKENNASLYGAGITAEDILSGKVKVPKEAEKLIQTLKKYTK